MIRRVTALVVAALFMMALAVPAFAISPQDAVDMGGSKVKGTVSCTTTDKPGNSDENGKGKQSVAVVEDETQGNLTNKSPEESQDLANNECTQGSPGLCKQAERQ